MKTIDFGVEGEFDKEAEPALSGVPMVEYASTQPVLTEKAARADSRMFAVLSNAPATYLWATHPMDIWFGMVFGISAILGFMALMLVTPFYKYE